VVVAVVADLALGGRSSGEPSLFLGRFHPLVVHLPIGLLLLLAFTEAASLLPSLRQRADGATSLALPLLVASAVAAFVLGHLLAGGGGFPSKLVFWHKRLTLGAIVGAGLCLAAWGVHERSGSAALRHAYRGILALTLGLLTVGAHYGGSITRGEGYLTKYAPEPVRRWLGEEPGKFAGDAPDPKPASPEPLVYANVVAPVLQQRCVECHGAETTKGNLRVDSLEALTKGGDNGPVIVSGQGDKSSLVVRMRLPMTDDERMPPEGREGPSDEEIALIAWWIDRGASAELRVRDAAPPEPARAALEKALTSSPAPSGSAPSPAATTTPTAAPTAEPSADPGIQGSTTDPPAPGGDGNVYAERVHPLLVAKCGKCHGEAKQKGKLRLDSFDAIVAGGKEGPGLVAGNANRSAIVSRARLPLSDPEHMPPPKEPQLTAKELELVAYWIDKGASKDLKTSELPAGLRGAAPVAAKSTPSSAPPAVSSAPAATASSAPTEPPSRPLPPELAPFRDVVHPILVAKCAGCHGEEQDSADLRVDKAELLLAGGRTGPSVVPGQPEKSLLLQRMRLPLEDVDHMPPEGEPQPAAPEIEAIRWWIAQGAKTDGTITTASLSPAVASMLAQALPPADAGTPPSPSASAAPTAVPSASPTASAADPSSDGPEPPGPPAVAGGGCAGCAVTPQEASSVMAMLALFGACAMVTRRLARKR
jgi:cytochrome c553/uncharacterized membrane protein